MKVITVKKSHTLKAWLTRQSLVQFMDKIDQSMHLSHPKHEASVITSVELVYFWFMFRKKWLTNSQLASQLLKIVTDSEQLVITLNV